MVVVEEEEILVEEGNIYWKLTLCLGFYLHYLI